MTEAEQRTIFEGAGVARRAAHHTVCGRRSGGGRNWHAHGLSLDPARSAQLIGLTATAPHSCVHLCLILACWLPSLPST